MATQNSSATDGVREIRTALGESRRLFVSIGLFSAFVNLLMLTGPLFMLQVYDRVLTSRSEATLVALIGIVAFLFLAMGLLDHARARVLARAGARFQARMDPRVLGAILTRAGRSPQARSAPATGLHDLEAMQRFASGPGPFAFFDAPWTPAFLFVLFTFHWLLGVLAFVSGLLLVGLALLNSARTSRLQTAVGESAARAGHFVEQLRAGAETVRGLGMRAPATARAGALRRAVLKDTVAVSDRGGAYAVTSRTLRLFLQSMMLGLGAWLAIQGEVTPGIMIAAAILLGRALAPIDQAVGQWPVLQRALQGRRSLANLLRETPEEPERTPLPAPKALLEAENLVVAPPGARVPAVRGVSFRLDPGHAIGIAGPSASGKSTLAKALAGVWPPMGGKATLGGAALDQYGEGALARHLGWLPQEVVLFEGTVAENIARLAPEPDPEAVVEAAMWAGAHEMILALPGGYDFQVAAGGAALSGGQRQRIALARAFYGDPAVVVLDEPDAHLDAAGAEALNRAIAELKARDGAAVIVAHRPGTFAECDVVLLMENGQTRPAGGLLPANGILLVVVPASDFSGRPKPLIRDPFNYFRRNRKKAVDTRALAWHDTLDHICFARGAGAMDPGIENLKSTTFFGRRLTRRQIADVQETVALFPALSRNELAKTICEHLNWTTPKGDYRVSACLRMLESLEECGILSLPAKRNTASGPRRAIEHTERSDPGPQITCGLADLEPLSLHLATETGEVAEWNELVDRHHWLGCPRPFGSHLRWFVLDREGRRLGCLLFEAAARTLPARDAWLGWSAAERDRRLHLAVSNSRFLIFPWVRVDNLASRALAMALRRLAGTWEQRHGCRPVLCETFVDPTRHDGASYRAANWEKIGMTAGYRGKNRTKPPKEILVMALDPDFRRVLKGESRPPKRSKLLSPVCDGPFVAMWMKIIDAAGELAAAHDREWMRRRRVLNSLIVMLFVFRLVLSRGTKGYATVVAELWDQCRKLGIALPQHQPVVASSICKARARVHEDLFLDLHREILRHGDDGGRWKGHRTFAIDGTKMNLPRPLAEAGYPLANANAHYPQGLVSCLYRLETKTPVDFSLSANADERAAARAHLDALSPGDVVVVDRGYFSFVLLHAMVSRGLHPVFRLQRNSAAVFDDFIDGDRNDALVRVVPKEDALRKLRAAFPGKRFDPVELRLVKCTAGENEYTVATTLADRERYTRSDLSDLYHGRWGIEELYKTSKTMIAVDEFHGRTERGVRQELYAHFNLIAMTRLLSNRGDGLLEELREEGSQRQTTNFKNALAMMAANLEEMVLARAAALAGTVAWMAERILAVRSRLRPGRSYPRQSMKPRSKWIRMARVTA